MNILELMKFAKPSMLHMSRDKALMESAPKLLTTPQVSSVGGFRAGQFNVPEEILGLSNSRFVLPNELPSRTTGRFRTAARLLTTGRFETAHINEVLFNHAVDPKYFSTTYTNPTHEFTHATNYNLPELERTRFERSIKPLAEIRAYHEVLRSLDIKNKLAQSYKLLDEDSKYLASPVEVVARGMANLTPKIANDIPDFRNNFHKLLEKEALDTIHEFKFTYPVLAQAAKPLFSKYLPAAAGVLMASDKASASTQPSENKTSNIDISANIPKGQSNIGEYVKAGVSGAKSFFEGAAQKVYGKGGKEREFTGTTSTDSAAATVGRLFGMAFIDPLAGGARLSTTESGGFNALGGIVRFAEGVGKMGVGVAGVVSGDEKAKGMLKEEVVDDVLDATGIVPLARGPGAAVTGFAKGLGEVGAIRFLNRKGLIDPMRGSL